MKWLISSIQLPKESPKNVQITSCDNFDKNIFDNVYIIRHDEFEVNIDNTSIPMHNSVFPTLVVFTISRATKD